MRQIANLRPWGMRVQLIARNSQGNQRRVKMQDTGAPVVRGTKHAVMKSAGLRIWQSCNCSGCAGGPKERVPRVSAADKHARLVCETENLIAQRSKALLVAAT